MKPTQWYDRQKRTPVTPEDQAEDWWCPGLRRAVHDRDTLLHYRSNLREYGLIYIRDREIMADHRWGVIFGTDQQFQNRRWYWPVVELISFCPYCGSQLPNPMTLLFEDFLVKAEEHSGDLDPFLPEEYESNFWWKQNSGSPNVEKILQEREHAILENTDFENSVYADYCFQSPPADQLWNPAYSCAYMRDFATDHQTPFAYNPRWREYGIRMIDWERPTFEQPLRYDRIHYSPWCGRRFPKSMKDEWLHEMKRLKIAPDAEAPPWAYDSDVWWHDHWAGRSDPDAGRTDRPAAVRCTPPPEQLPDWPPHGMVRT
ncbi:DUF6980 family protein [Minwuia sp.]|uniref:DUF6980 family protein n=1 Tax=Minwuia sp. TaxID=2493630 RepID=UPI003A948416